MHDVDDQHEGMRRMLVWPSHDIRKLLLNISHSGSFGNE